MVSKNIEQENINIINGLKFAETIRNLDANTALRISLTLAGNNPRLFLKYIEATKPSNIVPVSTLKLAPVPVHIV